MKHVGKRDAGFGIVATIIFGLAAGCTPALSQAIPGVPDAGRGEALAQKLCSSCHIPDPNAARLQGTADVPTFPEIATAQGQTTERIIGKLIIPAHPMPTIPLTRDHMADLAAYIMSLK